MRQRVWWISSIVLFSAGVWLTAVAGAEETKTASEKSATAAERMMAPAPVPAVAPPTVTPPVVPAAPAPAAPAKAPEVVVLDDELPVGATTTGNWVWETQAASGAKSHSHPSAAGLQQHAVTFATPVTIPKNGEVVTSVWLDPANPPKGVMVKFTLTNGDETGVYWEGEEEVFSPGEDEEVWYYGLLPEFGAWAPLAVAAEDLGIEDASVKTITFVTHGGRVLWDRTVVRTISEASSVAAAEEPSAGTPY